MDQKDESNDKEWDAYDRPPHQIAVNAKNNQHLDKVNVYVWVCIEQVHAFIVFEAECNQEKNELWVDELVYICDFINFMARKS